MGQRLELHSVLLEVLGTAHVYFQPPASLAMEYPCIVYTRDGATSKFADNESYVYKQRYQVTYIDPHPDSDILLALVKLPNCRYDRWFAANNLNHDVFQLYY